LSLGGGGLSIVPTADSFVLQREDLFAARAGGGFLFALRNRILVRLADPVMQFEGDPLTANQVRHAVDNREGSFGGSGVAGGGCGCN
jgi:hypothetical protein